MRQISKVLTQENNDAFDMKKLNLKYLTLTQYDQRFSNVSVLYSKENIKNTLGEVLSNNSKKQLRMLKQRSTLMLHFFSVGERKSLI